MAALLAGCGSAPTAPAGDVPDGAVVIEHAHGTTVVPEQPRRVVALGQVDVQVAHALGADLVGAAADPTSEDGNWPGVELPADVVRLDDDVPEIERIASLRPDVILAVSAHATYLAAYDQLAAVAPVVAGPGPPLTSSGEDLALLVGRALFRADDAADLVDRSDRAVEAFVAAHPELAGVTYAFGLWADRTLYVAVGPDLQAVRFLGRLGLRLPRSFGALAEVAGPARSPGDGLVALSEEHLDRLGEADLVLVSTWGTGSREEFTDSPVVASSGLAASERLRMIGPELAGPLLEPNPAVTEYLLRGLGEQVRRLDPRPP